MKESVTVFTISQNAIFQVEESIESKKDGLGEFGIVLLHFTKNILDISLIYIAAVRYTKPETGQEP